MGSNEWFKYNNNIRGLIVREWSAFIVYEGLQLSFAVDMGLYELYSDVDMCRAVIGLLGGGKLLCFGKGASA